MSGDTSETIKNKIRKILAEELELEDVSVDDIGEDDLLFGGKLGLDSIDAVEMVYQIKRCFGIQIRDMKEGRQVLQTINTIAEYVRSNAGS